MVLIPRKRFEYEKARSLRQKGVAYSDIRTRLKISKSTISLWCRDIKLSKEQRKSLYTSPRKLRAQRLGSAAMKLKRNKEITIVKNLARYEIPTISLETLKIIGAVIYWAEGAKSQSASLTNSDPRIIKLILIWLKQIFGIIPDQLKAHLHIHYGNDEKKIKKYWSQLTGIPLKNFYKCFIKPKGTGHRTNILPNGIIKIRVSGIGTENLRHRIMAWYEKIFELIDTTNPPLAQLAEQHPLKVNVPSSNLGGRT